MGLRRLTSFSLSMPVRATGLLGHGLGAGVDSLVASNQRIRLSPSVVASFSRRLSQQQRLGQGRQFVPVVANGNAPPATNPMMPAATRTEHKPVRE